MSDTEEYGEDYVIKKILSIFFLHIFLISFYTLFKLYRFTTIQKRSYLDFYYFHFRGMFLMNFISKLKTT